MNNLTNAFHTVAAFFSGQAPGSGNVPFTFEARDSIDNSFLSSFTVPGLSGEALDFIPTDAVSSFVRTFAGVSWQNDPIGGGFGETRLSLLCGYGTGVRVVPDEEIDALITSEYVKIDELLLASPHYLIRNALKDRFVFRACSTALQDGIILYAYDEPDLTVIDKPDAVGLYLREIHKIYIATKLDKNEVIDTIQHELLHYVFNKSPNVLGNVEVEYPSITERRISEPHFVLELVMEKLQTRALCKKGLIKHLSQLSWSANIIKFKATIGDFVQLQIQRNVEEPVGFDIQSVGGVDILSLIDRYKSGWGSNNHNVIMSLLDDPSFAQAFVAAQLIPLMPQPEFPEMEHIPLLFTPEMYQDMAFLHAQRYAMYVHGIYELSLISKRTGRTMENLFASEDADDGATLRNFGWHTRMDAFFVKFFEALITDPMEGVLAIERRLRKP